jgi:hypothetical protein
MPRALVRAVSGLGCLLALPIDHSPIISIQPIINLPGGL